MAVDVPCPHLLRFFLADVCTSQHSGLDCGQDLQLSADSWDTLTNLE